jgi:glyoxylase-like metal-dependent hydrolase (beta-lactamase superfamily II)
VVIPASTGGSLTDYLASLERVDALGAARVLPAHGDAIEDPHALIRAYIDHRQERERQVLAALRDGKGTVTGIADAIYVELPASLHAMARESVLAHLVKLASEGTVRRDGDTWSIAR